MDNSTLLQSLLMTVGYRLPILIALGVALVMLMDTPRSRARTVAMSALAMLMLAALVGARLNVLPLLMIAAGNFNGLSALNTLLNIGQAVVALTQAAGFILLAWALVQALRRPLLPGKP